MSAGERDLDREARLIWQATASLNGVDRGRFAAAVAGRLQLGNRLYANRWHQVPLDRLLGELLEEGLDLGAWAVLADQRLDTLDLDPAESDRIRRLLLVAIRAGAIAHQALTLAREGTGA